MAQELTAIAIEKIKPGATQRGPDGRIGGLYFIVQPSGKRSWALRYRFGSKSCKLTIGAYPGIDLKRARELAGEAKNKLEEGGDPHAEKISRRRESVPASDCVEHVTEQFIRQVNGRNAIGAFDKLKIRSMPAYLRTCRAGLFMTSEGPSRVAWRGSASICQSSRKS